MCPICHHGTHDNNQTLVNDPETNTWTTRPATPEETVTPRPGSRQRTPKQSKPKQSKPKRRKPKQPDHQAAPDTARPPPPTATTNTSHSANTGRSADHATNQDNPTLFPTPNSTTDSDDDDQAA